MFISVYGELKATSVTINAASVNFEHNLSQLVSGELTGECVERESYRDCKTRPVDFHVLLTTKRKKFGKTRRECNRNSRLIAM